jgi:hypothetical protein
MAIKYLYIDDENQRSLIENFTVNLSINNLILEPLPQNFDWKKNIRKLLEESIINQNIQGILFDWNLTDPSKSNPNGVTSVGMAQHLRQFISFDANGLLRENKIDIPFILCSSRADIMRILEKDRTSIDLFDRIYPRDYISDNSKKIIQEFISLAKGYQLLNNTKSIKSILGIEDYDLENLDIRFREKMRILAQNPSHETARFILNELIDYQGILINEDVLAARLGIDINNSKGWEHIKEKLNKAKYKGVFGDAWETWWWVKVEKWWENNFPDDNLAFTSAKNRIELLSSLNFKNIVAAEKLQYAISDEFWTVCEVLKKPIDISDGFMNNKEISYPWQERDYISKQAILEDDDIHKVNILERKRLSEFKNYIRSKS